MKKVHSVKANVNMKTRILIFTGLLVLCLVLSSAAVASQSGPALKITELAFPTRYTAIEQNITYFYMVTNPGNVSLTGNINITDNVTGTTTLSTDGLDVGSILTGTSIHTITQADIDAGSVTNLASATGSFNNQPVISPNAIATVIYERPTNSYGPTNDGYREPVVPITKMHGSEPYGYNSEHYGYGSEPYGYSDVWGSKPSSTSEVPNSNSQISKAKVSMSDHKYKHHKTKKTPF